MKQLKLACIGAGYFARFHLEAWQRIPGVELSAICDRDLSRAQEFAKTFRVPNVYGDVADLLAGEELDLVDIITPPESHAAISRVVAQQGIDMICQKPLAPTLAEAREMVEFAGRAGVRLLVHENWRFQPWYRKVRELLDRGVLGDRLHTIYFRMRTGDGWGEEAYLGRQPYFRTMPRLLIYETGIHFIDTFRYLAGEVKSVFADLRKLNPVIRGEDAGLVFFEFENGTRGVFDANRYNESNASNSRYTFGELLVEGSRGSIRLDTEGRLTVQLLGETEKEVSYPHDRKGFASDCVFHTQSHLVDCLRCGASCENEGRDYLANLVVQEAIYRSAQTGAKVAISGELF